MKRNDEEHRIQSGIIRCLRPLPECEWLHAIPNGGKRAMKTAVKLKKEGVKAGIHDLFLPWVVWLDGRILYPGMYMEVKAGKNRLTPEQKEFKIYAEKQGYKCVTVWSVQEGVDAVLLYLGRMK